MKLGWVLVVILSFAHAAGASEPLPFARAVKNPISENESLLALQSGVTRFENASGNVEVTLIPAFHYAQPEFYQAMESILEASDRVLYEGLRPAGFFGPPFDDESLTNEEHFERTKTRLLWLKTLKAKFAKSMKREAASWDELLGSSKSVFQQTLLFDTWGQPFHLTQDENGGLDAFSDGLPGQARPIHLSELPRSLLSRWSDWTGSFVELAQSMAAKQSVDLGLEFQRPFSVYARPTSVNIDTAEDQFSKPPFWRAIALKIPELHERGVGRVIARKIPKFYEWAMNLHEWGMQGKANDERSRYPIERARAILRQLPPTEITKVAIVYGTDHIPDFHRLLLTEGFSLRDQHWLTGIEARLKDGKAASPQDSKRAQMILQMNVHFLKQAKNCEPALAYPSAVEMAE